MSHEEYAEFWAGIKTKITTIASLDGNRTLIDENERTGLFSFLRKDTSKRIMVDGARRFGYQIFRTVSEKHLIQFEERNKINLPIDYRSYLQYFGAGGVGPGQGIHNFNEKIFDQDISVPFSLKKPKNRKVVEYDEEDNHPINEIHDVEGVGVVPINHYGASDGFLVLNGSMHGEVFAWNHDDHIFFKGTFTSFYENWADDVLEQLENYHNIKKIKIGMTLNQAETLMQQKSERMETKNDDNLKVTFDKTDASLEIDSESKVTSIYISNYYLID